MIWTTTVFSCWLYCLGGSQPYFNLFEPIPILEAEGVIGFGGVQSNIFGRISFELWAPQVPLMIGKTFSEVPGPWRPTVSEPRPAQKLGVK